MFYYEIKFYQKYNIYKNVKYFIHLYFTKYLKLKGNFLS